MEAASIMQKANREPRIQRNDPRTGQDGAGVAPRPAAAILHQNFLWPLIYLHVRAYHLLNR